MPAPVVREVWTGCPFCFADPHDGPCALVAHLPGKHNQKDHAARKRKGGLFESEATAPTGTFSDEAQIRAAYEFHDPATGLTTKITGVAHYAQGNFSELQITVYDSAGTQVGVISRAIHHDTNSVGHSSINLDRGLRGQGFATRFNANAEQKYREAGVESIRLHAGSTVGGYAWARAGYGFADPASRQDVGARALEAGGKYSASVRSEIRRVVDNPNSSPIDFAMIGHTAGAETWPGKEIMLGSEWDGVKIL